MNSLGPAMRLLPILLVLSCETPARFDTVACDTEETTVTIGEDGFDPHAVEVRTNTVVRWDNESGQVHSVTSGASGDEDAGQLFDSGPIDPGASFCLTPRDAGDFLYFSSAGDLGTLEVQWSSTGGTNNDPGNNPGNDPYDY